MIDQPSTADIRQCLFDFFNDEELTTMCFDYFPVVHSDFAADMAKGRKIQLLLEYCQRREIFPNLLAAIQKARPEQYEKRFPQAARLEARPEPTRPVRDPKLVFISHTHQDADFAHRLANDLQQNGWRVWIAPDSIRPGEMWGEGIDRGMDESGVLVLVLTPRSVQSPWVRKETYVAIQLESQGRIKFIPLEVEPCDVPGLWSTYQRISFQSDYGSGLTALLDALEPERHAQREREAQEKAAREEAERLERELGERRKAAQAEAERQARLAAEKAEADRLAGESREREAQEKARREETERQAKLAAEQAEAVRLEQERNEREAREKAAQEEAARKAREEAERKAHEEAAQRETGRLGQYRAAQAAAEREAGLKVISSQPEPAAGPQTAYKPQLTRWIRSHLPGRTLPVAASVLVMLVLTVIAWLVGSTIYNNAANSVATQTAVAMSSTQIAVFMSSTSTPFPVVTRIAEKDGMVMVHVPAGEFVMGSDSGDEKPRHKVYLDAFWIDRTEVTNAQYNKCVQAGKCKASSYANDTKYNGDNQPVVGVDWIDATTYCAWAGGTLPTEAQWEKAARGTDGRLYPWGNQTATCDYAVMDDGSMGGCGKRTTWPVGSKLQDASPYGVLDMAGNVREWVADWYDSKYYANSPASNPTGPSSGQYRVLRGGSWYSTPDDVRAAYRIDDIPGNRYDAVGFRCVSGGPGE